MTTSFQPGKLFAPLSAIRSQDYLLAASQSIRAGDLLVLTNVAGPGLNYARKVTSTDIANHFSNGGTVLGLLGVAMDDAFTDVNGVATGQPSYSTVNASAAPILAAPTLPSVRDVDPITGRSRIRVALAVSQNTFYARAAKAANATTTVTGSLPGSPAGIQIVNTTDFSLNLDSVTVDIVGAVDYVLEEDPLFNVVSNQCRVGFRFSGAYSQYDNQQLYGN